MNDIPPAFDMFHDTCKIEDGFLFKDMAVCDLGLETSAPAYLDAVASRIGYRAYDIEKGDRAGTLANIISRGLEAASISGIGKPVRIDGWDKRCVRAGPVLVESPRWALVVDRAVFPHSIYCFFLTLGREFDRVKEANGLFESYVLDGLGSELTERVADSVEEKLRGQLATSGLACSRRFSPGYCDWPLANGQKSLSKFMDTSSIGLTVLSSGAMVPAKSVSGAMIVADRLKLLCPCPVCPKKDCPYRREDVWGEYEYPPRT